MSSPRIQSWIPALLLAFVPGIALWLVLEYQYPFFRPSDELLGVTQATPEQMAEMRSLDVKNKWILFSIFGGVLGSIVVTAAPGSQKSLVGFASGLVLGLLGGFAGGAIGTYFDANVMLRVEPMLRSTSRLTLVLLPLATAIALSATLASKISVGRFVAYLVSSLVGAILTALVYSLITGALLSHEGAEALLPAGGVSRFLLFALPGLVLTLTLARQALGHAKPTAASSSPTQVSESDAIASGQKA